MMQPIALLPYKNDDGTTSLLWDEQYSPGHPFEVEWFDLCTDYVTFPCKEILLKNYGRQIICVRTDVYPLMWVYWWMYLRFEMSGILLMQFVVQLFEVWGLAQIPRGEYSNWRNIRFLQSINAWWRRVHHLE